MSLKVAHYIYLHIAYVVAPSTTIALPVNQSHFADADFAEYLEQRTDRAQVATPGVPPKNTRSTGPYRTKVISIEKSVCCPPQGSV